VTPYYSDDWVTIYHGDCLEVPAVVGSVQAVVTDPPYNVGIRYRSHDDAMPEDDYLRWLRVRLDAAVLWSGAGPIVWFWPGSRLARGEVTLVLPLGYDVHHVGAWFKREFAGDLWKSSHPAYSWEPIVWAARPGSAVYHGPKGGHAGRDGLLANSPRHDGQGGPNGHPCPKPLSVVAAVLPWVARPGDTVLDPFAGSGTTLLAAKRHGMRSIGIEIDERYCDQAARRVSQETLGLSA
jgi:site-specific DNA-methyltransferase (adenine-specific)